MTSSLEEEESCFTSELSDELELEDDDDEEDEELEEEDDDDDDEDESAAAAAVLMLPLDGLFLTKVFPCLFNTRLLPFGKFFLTIVLRLLSK